MPNIAILIAQTSDLSVCSLEDINSSKPSGRLVMNLGVLSTLIS
jgi:hypothetical protein